MTLDSSTSSISTDAGASNLSWSNEQPSEPTWRPPRPAPKSTITPKPTPHTDTSNYPDGKKSLAGISIRAFVLGITLGLSICLTTFLAFVVSTPLWRVPFFLASLSLFHFLEFWVTAQYNTRFADVSAFLLSSNGWAYNVAHGSAVAECLLAQIFFPGSWFSVFTEPLPGIKVQVVIGLLLVVLGQTIRTLAMAQAGSNFNHTVQVEHREGHRLVRHGVYAFLRHPSYFGFFWWGLGTQLVLGNVVCFMGYSFVLWRFFSSRIYREEKFLISFFGDEYVEYKKSTRVGIPAIP